MENIEKWKDIPDYEGIYQVSNWGNVKSLNYNHTGKERLLKPCKDSKGYLHVGLWKNRKRKCFTVHKLVALAFILNDNPTEKTQINHLDENKENNHVSNLCWCSCIDNNNYGTRNLRVGKAISKPILQYTKNMVFIREWQSARQASKELNMDNSYILKCCKDKQKSAYNFIWKYKE